MANYLGLRDLVDTRNKSTLLPQQEIVVQDDEISHLVSLVYKPDERTGLASSDLNVLFSDSVPSAIADWVRSQVMRPVGFAASSIKNGVQVDDDTLFALTRDMNETTQGYINRVDGLLKQWNLTNEGD